jgi:tetratricopeptide (TPR) repeat protein
MTNKANAILFNNAGATLLQEGRYSNAMNMFGKSLKLLKLAKSKQKKCQHLPLSFDDRIAESPFLYDEQIQSSGFVFTEPIFIDQEEGECLRLCATILFNLGLVYHLQGIRCRSIPHLQKAATLYEACLKVQIKNRFDLGDFYKLLVLPNNLGHVNMRLGHTKRAEGYMRFLSHQLASYSTNKSAAQETKHDLEGFFDNTTCLCLRQHHSIVSPSPDPNRLRRRTLK